MVLVGLFVDFKGELDIESAFAIVSLTLKSAKSL